MNSNNDKTNNSNANTSSNAKNNNNNAKKSNSNVKNESGNANNKSTNNNTNKDGNKNTNNSNKKRTLPLRIIPLGGLREIGKNLTVLEYENEMIIIDCGLSFPDDEMYGIDIVIPDLSYLVKNQKKIKGIVITHGHEDHIGAVPYLLKRIPNVPIFGTALPLGLIKNKLDEHGLQGKLNKIKAGDTLKLGRSFKVEAIRTTHSIADSVCLSIETPVGNIFHTGDFKIDYTPVDGEPIDLSKLAELGKKGVLLMMADSTNAIRKGFTLSEKIVGEAFENIVGTSKSRIIIATFSSNVHRVQKIIDHAVKYKRKVAVSGRSMVNVVSLAIDLGYLKVPKGTLVDINRIKNIPDKELIIVTTGSQGEPMSALSRMANQEHRAIEIKAGDQIVLSSSPIPGNEKLISNVVNKLLERGAEVIYSDISDTHVSGHACEEELKIILSLIKPKFFMPVHGEFRQLKAHEEIAKNMGVNSQSIFLLENGDSLDLTRNSATLVKNVAHAEAVMVDGLGVGDVGNIVLRDRRLLSESGLIIVVASVNKKTGELMAGPDIISRGFVYVRDNEDLMGQATTIAKEALERCKEKNIRDWSSLKNTVREDMRRFLYSRTKRNPVILPIFMEV